MAKKDGELTPMMKQFFDFKAKYSLREGLREAIAWYRQAGWL